MLHEQSLNIIYLGSTDVFLHLPKASDAGLGGGESFTETGRGQQVAQSLVGLEFFFLAAYPVCSCHKKQNF